MHGSLHPRPMQIDCDGGRGLTNLDAHYENANQGIVQYLQLKH